MSNNRKDRLNLLVIGGNSKIGEKLINSALSNYYQIHSTYNKSIPKGVDETKLYKVNLLSKESIISFLKKVQDIEFSAILFLSSTHKPDPTSASDYADLFKDNFLISSITPLLISKNIKLTKSSKIILFGDAGLDHPRPGYSNYTVIKSLLSETTKALAVDLAPKTGVICINLGPTYSLYKHYDGSLLDIESPVKGLVNLVNFILQEKDLNMSGCEITYDGGQYLKRTIS